MYQFHKLFRWSWSILVMFALAFAMAGCDGKDGATGPQGPPGMDGSDGMDGADGPPGPPGDAATVTPLESCGVCHDAGSFADATDYHDVSGVDAIVGAFSGFDVTEDGADIVVSFSATVDGAPATSAVFDRLYVSDGVVRRSNSSREPVEDRLDVEFTVPGDGTFTARIIGGVALFADAPHRYLGIVEAGPNELEIAAVGDYPSALPLAGLAAAEACVGCHGPSGEGTINPLTGLAESRFDPRYRGGHYSAPMSADACVVCHRPDDPSTPDEDEEPSYMRLVRVVHGIHNSHNFPDHVFVSDRDTTFDVTYPTYMTNCSVCHKDDDILPGPGVSALAAANAMPVSQGCFTCHGSMDSWATYFTPAGHPEGKDLTIHFSLTPTPETSNCASCHNNEPPPVGPGVAANKLTVADSHNGLTTERGGIIWDGEDTSVTEGAKFVWEIIGVEVVDAGANLAISWQASYDGAVVDPCNADLALGPAFHAIPPFERPDGSLQNRNNLSMLRNYAQGDDFILGESTSSPGQALNVGVSTDNTECLVANVATTTIPADSVTAERGIVALQGKPWVLSADPDDADGVMQVRAKTPTYEFMVADGSAPVATRRDIVDADACLTCHVGSLYQHGGNRVDNPGMCILCHNSASNEKNVRTATMGIDVPADTYDGKVGETFELKTMLHRIHSAGVAGQPPYVIYRGRGVYAFAPDRSELANWPGEGSQAVFGSTIGNVVNGVQQPPPYVTPPNFHAVTYPRALNNCEACHAEGSVDFQPDQTQAMATTLDAGGTEWKNQDDDVLQGATTTACVTCHTGGPAKGHAYQNGWEPQEFPEGRKTIIDAVK